MKPRRDGVGKAEIGASRRGALVSAALSSKIGFRRAASLCGQVGREETEEKLGTQWRIRLLQRTHKVLM